MLWDGKGDAAKPKLTHRAGMVAPFLYLSKYGVAGGLIKLPY